MPHQTGKGREPHPIGGNLKLLQESTKKVFSNANCCFRLPEMDKMFLLKLINTCYSTLMTVLDRRLSGTGVSKEKQNKYQQQAEIGFIIKSTKYPYD